VHEVAAIASLNRINEGDLLINNEIGIIGGSPVGGIAVKISGQPVYGSDPIYIFTQFNGLHCSILLLEFLKICNIYVIFIPLIFESLGSDNKEPSEAGTAPSPDSS
jgi:hypothetical protein